MSSAAGQSKWAAPVLLLMAGTGIGLGIGELGFRVLGDGLSGSPGRQPEVLVHRASDNPKLVYQPAPDAENDYLGMVHRINRAGFRDREFSAEKTAGVTRILFLGDSVVYGWGLEAEETIPKQIERAIRRAGQSGEVLNFGVSGYEAEQAVEFFKELGQEFAPDVVLLGYTLNDSGTGSFELRRFFEMTPLTIKVPRPDRRLLDWLYRHSAMMATLDRRLRLQERFPRLRSYDAQSPYEFTMRRERALADPPGSAYRGLRDRVIAEARRRGTPAEALEAHLEFTGLWSTFRASHTAHWNLSKRAFLELKDLSQRHGFDLIAVIFPHMLEMDRYPLGPVHAFLVREFRELGFGVVDLLDWAAAQDPSIAFEPIHFSPRGASLVGEYLYRRIFSTPDGLRPIEPRQEETK